MTYILRNYSSLFIISFLCLFFTSFVQAQTDPTPINQGGKWSYTKIGGIYDYAQPFYPILEKVTVKITVKDEKGAIVKDAAGKPKQVDSTYYKEIATLAAVSKDEKWGFIDTKGKIVVPLNYDFVRDFGVEGYAAVGVNADPFPQWTLIDYTGKEITSPKFDGIGDFSDGLASVSIIDTSNFDAPTIGFIDAKGQLVIPVKFGQAHDFHEGMAAVSINGVWGFVNKKGQIVISPQYEKVYDFSEGLAKVYSRVKWGFIDKTGKIVINFQYQDPGLTYGTFNQGLARVRLNYKEGWIDNRNVARIPIEFNEARDFSDHYAAVKSSGKWGFIDSRGRVAIEYKYSQIGDFSEGLAPVFEQGKWGFIDTTGKMKIAPKYDDVRRGFTRGIAMVTLGDKSFYIDQAGKEYVK
jgi:hypothetical protein